MAMSVQGATIQLSDKPMASGGSVDIKPNIMLILDDSGSMGWSHMPDFVRFQATKYGYKSSQCNSVYYNPNITYTPPVKADGTSYPNASFTSAPYNGFSGTSSNVNLSTSFRAYDTTTCWYPGTPYCDSGTGRDASQQAYYYKYSGTETALDYTYNTNGTVDTNSNFYKQCNSSIDITPGKLVFTKITVSATSGPGGIDERQNFANWYSYYRVRMYMAKTAIGKAFGNLSNPGSYRIGFTTHSYPGRDGSLFLNINDYCSSEAAVCAQRTSFFDKLYSADPDSGTPLRAALSRAGRIFAGKIDPDPVQYSCQQNFAILATDGYWNNDAGYKVDGSSAIGNQDGGTTARPMLDAAGKSNTLADVAMYYYQTDLRDGTAFGNCTGALGGDVCANNVPGAGRDKAVHQHMTTFTLGLGIDGSLKYAENYEAGGSEDYKAIVQGTKDWPNPMDAEDLHRIDDLWHAAVNGRGTYYSTKTPDSLASGLSKALAGVSARTGSAAAAATSNLEPVSGDNFAYVGMYTTVDWDGDIQARTIDLDSGAVSEAVTWSAQQQLDSQATAAADTRTIYTSVGGVLKTFTAANLSAAIDAKYFNVGTDNPNGALSQYPDYVAADQTAATPTTVINYLRGQSQHEDQTGNTYRLYRDRKHVLGDIVNSQPVYVKKPPFKYSDNGYADYAADKATRQSVVFVGGNDGMLHAFSGDSGAELWAYVPSAVIPNLYKLADKAYSNNHRYYVDGAITVGDVCFSPPCTKTQWKTILVAGLGKGGRAFFAFDITNPTSPVLLWEFTTSNNANLGYSYGNPVITKRNGQWVVIVASGYNNVSPGDGKGRLFVLNAETGAEIINIVTDASETDPSKSGIAKINNWVDNTLIDNATQYVYGGDLDGNVWRFDILAATATKLATIGKVAGASTQPITSKPELGEVKFDATKYKVVFVGGGRYLGTDDISNTDMMSLYAIRDDLASTHGFFRTATGVVVQDVTGSTGARSFSYSALVSTSPGWYVDFDVKNGERVTADPKLQLGRIAVATNIPDPNVCNIGGTSWLYFFDYYPKTADVSKESDIFNVGNALVVGLNVIRLPNGKTVTIVTTSDNKHPVFGNPPPAPGSKVRRIYWRELLN